MDTHENSRRGAFGIFAAGASGLIIPGLVIAADDPTTAPKSIADLKAKFPVLARCEGVWKGVFRRFDGAGKLAAEFKSTITKRYLQDAPWPKVYHQTNHYDFADGKSQTIDTFGHYADGKIHFESDRVKGWQLDDPADPFKRSIFLHMVYKNDPEQYVYELINVSDDGKYRTRMTQFLKGGRTVQRTMIDEEKVTSDWSKS